MCMCVGGMGLERVGEGWRWFVRVSLFYIPIQMYGREVRDAARTAYNRPKQLVKYNAIHIKEIFGWYNWKYTKRNNIGLPQCVPHD